MSPRNLLPELGEHFEILFGCMAGQHVYGAERTDEPVTHKWVYYQSVEDRVRNGYKPSMKIGDNDVAYEMTRFVELAIKGNPFVLEMLFVAPMAIIYCHELFHPIVTMRNEFLHQKMWVQFKGAIEGRISRIEERQRLMDEKLEKKTIVDFCTVLTRKPEGEFFYRPLSFFRQNSSFKLIRLVPIEGMENSYSLFWTNLYNKDPQSILDDEMQEDIIPSKNPINGVPAPGLVMFDKEAYKKYKQDVAKFDYLHAEFDINQRNLDDVVVLSELVGNVRSICRERRMLVSRERQNHLQKVRTGKFPIESLIGHAASCCVQIKALFEYATLLPRDFEKNNIVREILRGIKRKLELESVKEPSTTKFLA